MKTTIIHNETCPICSREVAHYAKVAEEQNAPFDVQGLDGAARHQFGLSEEQAAKRFHVVQDGALISGIDAFLVVWETLPRFNTLAKVISLPIVYRIAVLTYDFILAPVLFALHKRRNARKHSV